MCTPRLCRTRPGLWRKSLVAGKPILRGGLTACLAGRAVFGNAITSIVSCATKGILRIASVTFGAILRNRIVARHCFKPLRGCFCERHRFFVAVCFAPLPVPFLAAWRDAFFAPRALTFAAADLPAALRADALEDDGLPEAFVAADLKSVVPFLLPFEPRMATAASGTVAAPR